MTLELRLFLIDVLLYFSFAGTAYLFFYVLFKKAFNHRIIQKKFEKNEQILEEIKYSLSTLFIFAINFAIVYQLHKRGWTRYHHVDFTFKTILYSVGMAAIMVLMHDTYFYWAHRLMHHPKIYKYVHQVHHRSINPSPWAALYFHPIEAFLEFGIIYIIVFTIPYNGLDIKLFYVYMLFVNVMGHLSIELFRPSFSTNGVLKVHNSATHHNMHHKYFNYNYGLYLIIWDRIMGTVHPNYYKTFEEVTSRLSDEEMQQLQNKTPEPEK